MRVRGGTAVFVAGVCLAVTAAGCGGHKPAASRTQGESVSSSPSPSPSAGSGSDGSSGSTPGTTSVGDLAMAAPAKLTAPLLSPDLLVYSSDSLPAGTVKEVQDLKGVTNVNTFSMGDFYFEERQVTYAAVDPATFRRYTPSGSAQTLAVWQRVADGEMAIRPDLGRQIQDKSGSVTMGNDAGSPKAHIGAYADLISRFGGSSVIDAVVNQKWASKLHMKAGNAMLVSTGSTSPAALLKKLKQITGPKTSVQILAVNLDISKTQTAVLTGGAVSDLLGTLNYTANRNGTVNPDPAWVRKYIRTQKVPILGRVTCNRVMLPELIGALNDVIKAGLIGAIHPSQYGGCYVPRFIAGTHSLSFHTFGTAIDLNVPGNQRGTVGQMNRQVVAIFEKWGFTWGGTWHYTDPMHFELHRIVRAS